MEYFELVKTTKYSDLPIDVGHPVLQDLEIKGFAQLGVEAVGYLSFCDRQPASCEVHPECLSTILTAEDCLARVEAAYPNAKIFTVQDPRAIYLDILTCLQQQKLIKNSSFIPTQLTISKFAKISEYAVIESGVRIDAGAEVSAGAVIRSGTWIKENATVGENCVLGSQGIYLYVGRDGGRRSFPHLGSVIVESGVSLGVSCAVPRGILSSTIIGANSIIGNLCNIGHGVQIAADVWISSGVILRGQTRVGSRATIAMGCVVKDNISIGESANVGMGSVVTKSIRSGQSVFGNPAKVLPFVNAGPVR